MRLENVGSLITTLAYGILLLSFCGPTLLAAYYDDEGYIDSGAVNLQTEDVVLEALLAWAKEIPRRDPEGPDLEGPPRRQRRRRWLSDQKGPEQQQFNQQQLEKQQQRQQQEQPQQTIDSNNNNNNKNFTLRAGRIRVPPAQPTRLLDEGTGDRAKLEEHYRKLESEDRATAAGTAPDRKKGPSAKSNTDKQRLQGVGVRGRLMCGQRPSANTKIKLVDIDPRPDRDDLIAETRTDESGLFHLSGATREEDDIEVIIKIYHDCLDEHLDCQRKATWRIPSRYYNNGTLTEWFDVGTVNMELGFIGEERDCRH